MKVVVAHNRYREAIPSGENVIVDTEIAQLFGYLQARAERVQDAAQSLADAGVRGILNFAPTVIQPRTLERGGQQEISDEWRAVIVENVDFLAGMKRLAFYILNPHLNAVTEENE